MGITPFWRAANELDRRGFHIWLQATFIFNGLPGGGGAVYLGEVCR